MVFQFLLASLLLAGPQEPPGATDADLYQEGRTLMLAGKIQEAKGIFEKGVRTFPASPWPHYGLAEIYAGMDRPHKAIEEITMAIDLAKATTLDTALKELYLFRANIHFGQSRLEETEADLKAVLSHDPTEVNAHYQLAFTYLLQDRLDEAKAQAMVLVKMKQRVDDAYSVIGQALFKEGKLEAAARVLRKAIELHPKHARAHHTLAQVLVRLGKREEAQAELEIHTYLQSLYSKISEALEQGPHGTCVHCWRILSVAYGDLGNYEEALKYSRKVVGAEPDGPEGLFILAHNQVGVGDIRGAVETLRRCTQVNPEYFPAYNNLAWILATREEVRDTEEAIRLAEKAVDLGSKLVGTLAEAHYQAGDKDKACEILERAIRDDPEHAEAFQAQLDRFRKGSRGGQ